MHAGSLRSLGFFETDNVQKYAPAQIANQTLSTQVHPQSTPDNVKLDIMCVFQTGTMVVKLDRGSFKYGLLKVVDQGTAGQCMTFLHQTKDGVAEEIVPLRFLLYILCGQSTANFNKSKVPRVFATVSFSVAYQEDGHLQFWDIVTPTIDAMELWTAGLELFGELLAEGHST